MPRLRREEGSTLILLIGIVAVLAVLAATLVMVSASVQGGTTTDKERATTFDVAEAGLDDTIYGMGAGDRWPTATQPYAPDPAFRTQFPVEDYPDPPAGKQFLTVEVYDNQPIVDKTITWDKGQPLNANIPDGKLWVEAQVNVGDKATRIRVQMERTALPALGLALGAVVYSGADARKTGSGDIESELVNGQPTGAVYVYGEFSEVGSGDMSTVTLKVKDDPLTNPPSPFPLLSQFMPDDYVQSLIDASQVSPKTATAANTYSGTWKPGKGTYPGPIVVNGNLKITGSGDYYFGQVYVTGDVDYSGSGTCTFAALYVGGDLDFSGSATKSWGPTYVGGDLDLTGSGTLNVSLIVVDGEIDVAGSGDISGDGVGTNAKPAIIISIGEDEDVKWTGSGNLYGLLVAMDGEFDHAGSGDVYGAEMAGKSWKQTGSGDIKFDSNVSGNIATGNIYITHMVDNTWQEISPK